MARGYIINNMKKRADRSSRHRTLYWQGDALYILDQLRLPAAVTYRRCTTVQHVARCIRDMVIRGAPAIGVAAAYGIVLGLPAHCPAGRLRKAFVRAKKMLGKTRPTAVNLFWALDRMENVFIALRTSAKNVRAGLLAEAHRIYANDIAGNKKIGLFGARLLRPRSIVLTHCNAGALATAGWGTALGIIRSAYQAGKIAKVYIDETRPYLQGARLTAWELCNARIPAELITDNMAGYMMHTGGIDAVIVGADRIAANGDVANKIGTYSLGILARYHRIPLYVAAPLSTIDTSISSGSAIRIEERSSREVTHIGRMRIAPRGMIARNPAFDVTPAALVSAIVTERGIIHRPSRKKIMRLVNNTGGMKRT